MYAKVELAPGDPVRTMLLRFQGARRNARNVSQTGEVLLAGKRSVSLDAKDAAGKARLLAMLADADVLVTNVRVSALQRLGLDYRQLKEACPQLVFAHVTAWGRAGPDVDLPGFDIGAFWSASGIAHGTHGPYMHSAYPVGFGDMATGAGLVGGIGLALTRRLLTGRGSLVENALYRYWLTY